MYRDADMLHTSYPKHLTRMAFIACVDARMGGPMYVYIGMYVYTGTIQLNRQSAQLAIATNLLPLTAYLHDLRESGIARARAIV